MRFGKRVSGNLGLAEQILFTEADLTNHQLLADTTIDIWFIRSPGPTLSGLRFLWIVNHLRTASCAKSSPEVTHEVGLYLLADEYNPNPLDQDSWVSHIDNYVSAQLELPSDACAMKLSYLKVSSMVKTVGLANPTSSDKKSWVDSLNMTAAYMRGDV